MRHTHRTICAGLTGALLVATPALAAPQRADRAPREPASTSRIERPSAVRGLRVSVDGRHRPVGSVRLTGLERVDESALWQSLGGRPTAGLSEEQVGQLLGALDRTGIFASVTPTLNLASPADAEGAVALDIQLEENRSVTSVTLTGAPAFSETALLQTLLATPPEETGAPPRQWLAHLEGEVVQPGILWEGLRQATRRVLARLFDMGYRMASVRGEWRPDGTLALDIDQGRIETIDLQGVSAQIQTDVRRVLGLEPGQIFLEGDVQRGLSRLRRELPTVSADVRSRPTRGVPQVVEGRQADGHIGLSCMEPESGAPQRPESTAMVIEGRHLVLHLRTMNSLGAGLGIFQFADTPATGGALDLHGRIRFSDESNRAHVSIDALHTILRAEASQLAIDNGQAVWRDEWQDAWNNALFGVSLRAPGLRTAELGLQWYQLVDSSDRWRMSRGHSSFYQLLLNRPDSEYYTRKGFTAFWTGHFSERLTLGIEYRRDTYGSLASVADPVSFSDDEGGWPNPAIDDGRMGSLLFRAEWSSRRVPARRVGALWRNTETSLIEDGASDWRTGLHSFATLEVADPSLGGDDRFDFTRLISDTTLTLGTGHERGVRLRARLAGGGDVPRQKEQALGGWSALRGFDSNEFRGDWSLFGTLEYRHGRLGGFLDLGSVRDPDGWTSAKLGVGVKLYAGDLEIVTAMRTDGRHGADPQFRVFVGRGF